MTRPRQRCLTIRCSGWRRRKRWRAAADLDVLPAPPRIRSAAPEERADLLVAPPVLPRSGAAEQADAPDAARREARGLPPRPRSRSAR